MKDTIEFTTGEELFVQLGERLREVFWICNATEDRRMLYLSPGFVDVWGLPLETLLSDTWNFVEYVHPEDRAALLATAKEETFVEEFRIQRPDKTERWLRARGTVLSNADGKAYRMVGIAEDITERKEQEHASRQNENLLTTLVDAMPDLLILMKSDGTITHFRGDSSLMLVSPPSIIGTNPRQNMPPEIAERVLACVQETAAGVKDARCEYKVTVRGERRYFECRFAPCGEEQILTIVRDITARKRAQLRLRKSRRRHENERRRFIQKIIAAQEDERRRIARELHDTMAQSLTSLLVGLRSLSDVVQDKDGLEAIQSLRTLTASTIEEAQRLARGLRPSVLDDMGFAPAMERLVADAEHAHGFKVDLHITGFAGAPRLTPVLETALYRILQEGLTNVARHAEATWVDLLIERHPNSVRAVVEDNGKGFDQHATSNRRGLGLLGIHERAALLHGQALVDSSPGSGTTLTVTLPLH